MFHVHFTYHIQSIMKAISASDEENSKSIRENVCKEIAQKRFPEMKQTRNLGNRTGFQESLIQHIQPWNTLSLKH